MKLLKDSAIYLFGELFAKALPFLLLPYLTRKLGVAGFGELSYYQTILALLTLIFGLSQEGALTRYYYFYGKRNLINVMRTAYAYTVCVSLVALLFAWWQKSLILAVVICTASSQTLLGTQLAWRQCQKRALSYTALQIGSGVLSSILTVILLELTSKQAVTMRFVAILGANLLISLMAYWVIRKEHKAPLTWRRSRLSGCYILAFGAPLLLHHASGFVKGQIDRVLIYQYFSAEELGIYAAALQIASILSIILMSLNKATVPYYYEALKKGSLNTQKVQYYALISLLLAPILAGLTWMLPESLFTWFLGANYIGTHHYIVLFVLGFALVLPYYLLVNHLFYHGKNKLISLISLASAGIYIVALCVLLPLGLAWLPFAMIMGNLAILPILYYFVRKT